MTLVTGVLREQGSSGLGLPHCAPSSCVHRQWDALLCSLLHTRARSPWGYNLLWQPRSWTSFRCMNLYLASLAFDSLSSCFFVYLPPWFGGFMGFSMHWKEFHVCNQTGWPRQDFHLLEQCLEVLGSNTALRSLFSWKLPGEGLVPY